MKNTSQGVWILLSSWAVLITIATVDGGPKYGAVMFLGLFLGTFIFQFLSLAYDGDK